MKTWFPLLLCGAISFGSTNVVRGTETENLGMRILPAAGKVVVDGKIDDWDLTGGLFACGDVENAANRFAVWVHVMYDQDNLYLLARWNDPTPLNNPGSSKGDYGFNGDCLQIRIVTAPDIAAPEVTTNDQKAKDAPNVRTTHINAWRDRDGLDVVELAYGRRFNEGGIKNAKIQGASQAFHVLPNGKGYIQEIAIPWKLLVKDGVALKAGMRVLMTFEPNFTIGTGGRLTIKDLFKMGIALDRVFTFQTNQCWGYASLEAKGAVLPRPVRLSDGREFPVRFEAGLPVIDWTGLTKSKLPDGFKTIKVDVPEDGYVSLNLFAKDGTVARQLLTSHFLTKGTHDILWDGLTTPSVRKPGEPVSPGEYTISGIHHTGIGLRLRGWAANSGKTPWNGWGADHGNPLGVAAAGDQVVVGWGGGEGDKPLLACDLNGNIRWKNIRGGIASAAPVATDGETVYAFNNVGQYAARAIYRVDAKTGRYSEWSALKTTDLTMKDLWGDEPDIPQQPSGLTAAGGNVFVSFSKKDAVLVVDAKTGLVTKRLTVPKASSVAAVSANQVLVMSWPTILSVDVATGASRIAVTPALAEKDWVSALAVDKEGNIYAGIRGGNHHVEVYSPDGKWLRTIGRKGGRSLQGPWTPDGMFEIASLAVDGNGKLWVAEDDGSPRRVSVWDAKTGAFDKEFFGASSYGATGAAINPVDPYLMVGQGCEWRIDPKTGKSTCVGTITREGMGSARFGIGPEKKVYLAVTPKFLHGPFPIKIYERLGDANYKLRASLREIDSPSQEKGKKNKAVEVWSDANGDAQVQPDEVKTYPIDLGGWFTGWFMSMTPDLAFYGSQYQVKVTGWTPCGAPMYDLTQAKKIAAPTDVKNRGGMGAQRGHGSADGRYMLWNGSYGVDHGTVDCYDIETGQHVWSYPSNFTGVHGSHRAVPAEVGMIRGAYDITGSAKFPAPVGNVWVIPTNKGEWHLLTDKGLYLTRLFEGDPTRLSWPEQAVPGASLDTCPPGAGEEAFGGSITQGLDGKLSVQAGHISFWNAEVVGIESVRALPTGSITINESDVASATTFRQRYLQEAVGVKRIAAYYGTPKFTGDLDKDFVGAAIAKFQKQDVTSCRTALAWDDKNLYVGWDVRDATPWVNGADAPEFLYARGDTVDLQLGVDPKAPKNRKDAVLGDLRLSIGSFEGKTTAVLYRKVANEKNVKFFSSGVVKGYQMDSVLVLKDIPIDVKVDRAKQKYVVEAAIPFAALGFTPAEGMNLRADFGVTHGNKEGRRTVLRTHWSNQNTGLVSDEVFELQMTPAAWGELELKR